MLCPILSSPKPCTSSRTVVRRCQRVDEGAVRRRTATGECVPQDTPLRHSSSYRAAFLCDVETYAGSNPRAIAEPLLAGLATSFVPDFADAAVRATISVPDATTSMELILALEEDLTWNPSTC